MKYFYTKKKRDWTKSSWVKKNLFKTDKKYYDYDDIEYKGIRDVRNLFDLLIGKDYYKPIRINNALNDDYIQYKSIGDKDKTLAIK